MGLDVAFNKAAADAAGIQVVLMANGSPEDIEQARLVDPDPDYIAWLQEEQFCLKVPGADHYTAVYVGAEKHASLEDIPENWTETYQVRANKWDETYGPLTEWLEANDITWSEF